MAARMMQREFVRDRRHDDPGDDRDMQIGIAGAGEAAGVVRGRERAA
jgi:hypothetical protein